MCFLGYSDDNVIFCLFDLTPVFPSPIRKGISNSDFPLL